jgi:hypothetical protein
MTSSTSSSKAKENSSATGRTLFLNYGVVDLTLEMSNIDHPRILLNKSTVTHSRGMIDHLLRFKKITEVPRDKNNQKILLL